MSTLKRILAVALVFVVLTFPADARRWIPKITVSGGGGPALVCNAGASGFSNPTTSARDTTGANLIVIHILYNTSASSITDSKSNTWTALTEISSGPAAISSRIYYCYGPTVGSGHTFTLSNGVAIGSIEVAAFSGMASSPFDVENGAVVNSTGTTIQPGSVTPSQANTLVVTGAGGNDVITSPSRSIDSSFTITDDMPFVAGTSYAGAMAYKILTSSSATNPTWTSSSANNRLSTIAVFKY